ncbi:hypothetical protein PHYPSEUDO_000055 [Phytophthora pseudosyringae]|uniref:Kinesin motor domain-containing protein n=1 Tax=Phytophthora pseudosyringae TaxID=221518 RepID=A0A8T1WNB7_9STRA|nr:hypothetical protein PHYPSEUDO_000055 [Phytophthora pseudosyringae]
MSARSSSTRDAAGEEGVLSTNDLGAPVLSQIHVSCYVTAANRASPVFEVLPQYNCVRVVNKSANDSSSGVSAGGGTIAGVISTISSGGSSVGPSVEWSFNSVFSSSSPSHAIDFFTEITLPALRASRDGINSNVVVWGVHPTQKFRLLFGKSVGGGGFAPQPEMAMNDVVDLYGQLVGMLHAFFSQLDLGSRRLQDGDSEPWRLGISSWIIVNNQAIDLLKNLTAGTAIDATRMSPSAEPLSFVSLEAPSLAAAFRIVQTAKTNRIVRKQNAESVHFFVRLALFHGGQVSTVHFVDLVDQKDLQDHTLIQEKVELYNILQNLRQPAPSPRQNSSRASIPGCGSASPLNYTGNMVLSNFVMPLLTANAKTFLYANVIDSRTSLRESVQMLNAVANLRGFACVCKPLRGLSFEQLGFQASPPEPEQQKIPSQSELDRYTPEAELWPTLNRSASSPPLGASQTLLSSLDSSQVMEKHFAMEKLQEPYSAAAPPIASESMSWLNAFTQRKRDILGGSIDTIGAITSEARVPERVVLDTALSSAFDNRVENEQIDATPDTRPSITDLYEQLRESLEDVKEIELGRSDNPRSSYCSLHSLPRDCSMRQSHTPLPIVDQDTDQEDFVQVGYSRSTIGGLTRHQSQPAEQHRDEDQTSWTSSDYAANNRPLTFAPSRYHEVSYANSQPEIDSVEPAEMSTPASPADAFVPRAPSIPSKQPDTYTCEALKKAGISPCVMEPPNVDGLDVKTAQKVQAADATLLRKNYDALLSIVREQQQAKEAAEARAAEAVQDQDEMRAMFEVQIENMKLANVGLRGKVRALEKRTSLPQVFEQYEQELHTLHAQIQEVQARNVALELRVGGSVGIGVAVGSSVSSTEFKKRYQQVVEDKLALEREVMEHRRKERHRQVHSRMAGESTRRADQLSRDLNNKEEDLVAARLSKQRLSAEMNQALEKADLLHHENEKLLQEKAATTEELLATRMYLASLDNVRTTLTEAITALRGSELTVLMFQEKKKASILDRFVEKHGDRMNKLRQHGQSTPGPKGESWRRDQYARECEDKLLVAVKRSLPQAVPLCNKLLRRLEMQELSLREFSEREVDFINLLVELVSDQPAVSLKRMIEQEMKKLQSC